MAILTIDGMMETIGDMTALELAGVITSAILREGEDYIIKDKGERIFYEWEGEDYFIREVYYIGEGGEKLESVYIWWQHKSISISFTHPIPLS